MRVRLPLAVRFAPIVAAGLLVAFVYPVLADTPSSEPAHAPRVVAYLVAGWDQSRPILAPSESANVVAWLERNGAEVRTCWWNSLHPHRGQSPGPWPRPFRDRQLVRDLAAEFDALPDDTQVILIGHSFGGDSLLKVAARTRHRIRFLGLLDATGAFGLRSRTCGRHVPPNVEVFWNRWQTAAPAPVDFFRRGLLPVGNTSLTSSDQKRAAVCGCSAHDHMQSDGGVERELLAALDRLNISPRLSEAGSAAQLMLSPDSDVERDQIVSDRDAGDHLRLRVRASRP